MTTTVTVRACCAENIEVVMSKEANGIVDLEYVLQNGQEQSMTAYNDYVIKVYERHKK